MQVSVEEPGNVAKYRHFDFDTGFDTDTHAKVPVFGGGEEGVTKRNVFDTYSDSLERVSS
jgi:hypothetical protein